MDNIEDKLRNLGEWKEERARVKPYIDIAVDCHNKAHAEARTRNFAGATHLYRQAIQGYRDALSQNPKYYLQDLLERVDQVIAEHVNNTFQLKSSGDALKNEKSITEFINFMASLKKEESKYIDNFDKAQAFFSIADFYLTKKNLSKALDFYRRVIEAHCNRPFINRKAYFVMGEILLEQSRYKEALESFVSALSFDRSDKEAISCIEQCLKKLEILEYRDKFLAAGPNEAKKLIMEVL